MTTIDFNRFFDIINYCDEQYEPVKSEIIDNKHSEILNRIYVYNKKNNGYYCIDYWRDYNNGIEDDEFEICPARQIQTVSYEKL